VAGFHMARCRLRAVRQVGDPGAALPPPRRSRACKPRGERRTQTTHPPLVRPPLVADGPSQVWSWDITALKAFESRMVQLYALDIFSHHVTGWLLANTEDAVVAEDFLADAVTGTTQCRRPRHSAPPGHQVQLVLAVVGARRDPDEPGRPSRPQPDPEAIAGSSWSPAVLGGWVRAASSRTSTARCCGRRACGCPKLGARHATC
jgi:transposase InsO family protein